MDNREAIADVQHEIWSHWMEYLFRCCEKNADGSMTIAKSLVRRWSRQLYTDYCDLTDTEKDSDREQADKVLAVLA